MKIEVWRLATGSEPLARGDSSIQAVVTDDLLDVTAPIWPRTELEWVAPRTLSLCGIELPGSRT